MKELLKSKTYEIEMKSSGQTREEAFQNLFKQLRKNIHSYIDGYLIDMHIESIMLIDETSHSEMKKLFNLFMPVEYTTVEIDVMLKIKVSEIDK